MLISSVHKSPTGKKGEKQVSKTGSHQPKAPARAKASKTSKKSVQSNTSSAHTHKLAYNSNANLPLFCAPLDGGALIWDQGSVVENLNLRWWNGSCVKRGVEDVGTAENMRGCSTFPVQPCSIFLTLRGAALSNVGREHGFGW